MSPLVQRTLVVFHLRHALVRIRRGEDLGTVVLQLLEGLIAAFPDEEEVPSIP
jgi:hypothetical protein